MPDHQVHVHVHEQPQGMNHVPHLILTFFTAGFWIPFWILAAILHACSTPAAPRTATAVNRPAPPRVRKDEYGITIPPDERLRGGALIAGGAVVALVFFLVFVSKLFAGTFGAAFVALLLGAACAGGLLWKGRSVYGESARAVAAYQAEHQRVRDLLELKKVMQHAEPTRSTDTFGTCPNCGHIDSHMITDNSEAGTTRNCAVCLRDWTVKHAS